MPRKKPRNAVEAAQWAMQAGDAKGFVSALGRVENLPRALYFLSGEADASRTQVKMGRTLLAAADFLLSQPREQVERFLPAMVIGAVHDRQMKSRRVNADASLARLRPLLAKSPHYASLVTAWAHGLTTAGSFSEAIDLFDAAIDCPDMTEGSYRNASWAVLQSNCGYNVDADLAKSVLARCLPHAKKDPAIFHNAALLCFEQGDAEGAAAHARAAKRHRYPKLAILERELRSLQRSRVKARAAP